jgi:predicted transcriptional regulator
MNKQLMISIIDAAKKQLNLGNSELSLKLGHNRNYISRVLHQENPTAEQMTKVVDKVKVLVAEQKESLPEFKHTPIDDAVMVSKEEYDSLKKSLDHKNQVLDKRNAVLENHIDRVNELELQLKTTQQKFIDVVDQKDKEIDKVVKYSNHATNQYHGKCDEVARLKKKIKNQTAIYLIIIVIISLVGIMGFAS